MKRTLTLFAALSSVLAGSGHAAVLAGWTFDTNTPTSTTSTTGPVIAAETGSGSFSGVHASSSTWGASIGNGSANSYASNTWTTGDYYQFSTSSTDYEGITITFDSIGHGSTTPRDFQLSYSVNGTNFTNFGTGYALIQNTPAGTIWTTGTPVSGTSYSFDLSAVSALNDKATIYFRVSQVGTTSVTGGTATSVGTVRIDNVTINGVPEPSALLLGAMGMMGLVRRRR